MQQFYSAGDSVCLYVIQALYLYFDARFWRYVLLECGLCSVYHSVCGMNDERVILLY